MPDAKLRIPGADGGYLVRANRAGFRSDREFVKEQKAGTFRALLFGDSQTAGDGIANSQRYSDLLEKAVPGLEIYNYGISGTGTDQQFLTYQEHSAVEHDLVVIGLYVENIRRVNSRIVRSRDANGDELYRAKPYYQIENNELVLHNVPVPKQEWNKQTLPADQLKYVYPPRVADNLRFKFSRWFGVGSLQGELIASLRRTIKSMAMRFKKFRPMPDYDAPDNAGWLLLRGIVETWIHASRTPVLLVPLPHYFFLQASGNAKGYQARFSELAESTGCHLYDPLPELLKLSAEERQSLWSDARGHLSAGGHEAIARLLAPVFESLVREQPHRATAAE